MGGTNKREILLYIIIIFLAIMVINKPKVIEEIIIPPIEGTFRDTIFIEIPIEGDKEIVYKDSIIKVPSQVNEKLLKEYEMAKDSIERLVLYIDMIQYRKYLKEYSDDNIDIKVNVGVTGRLEDLDIKYKTKEKRIEVPREPILIRGGVSAQVRDRMKIVPSVSLEDRNNVLYTISGSKDQFSAGVQFPIIRIK